MAERTVGFDEAFAGKHAECDGGWEEGGFPLRQEFAGTLTGDYFEEGSPPWRWYLLTQLTRKPEGYPDDSVWCESGFLYFKDEKPSARTEETA